MWMLRLEVGRRVLYFLDCHVASWIERIYEDSNSGRIRRQKIEETEAFCTQLL